MKPLTNEQIWGLPDDELPTEVPKDYFNEAQEVIEQPAPQDAGQGEESD